MAYVEVRKGENIVTRRLVDDAEAMKGCRIRLGSAGKVILKIGESKVVGKYEVSVHEGMPSDDAHKAVDGLSKSGDSFPEMSATETASMEDIPVGKPGVSKSGHPVIEGYQIIGRLGEGGMGIVWRAVQLSTKREVALKFMGRHRFASDKARARFEREVSLAAKLTHPNIARVYHSGIHRGVYYYAMELVDGVHLDKYVQQNLPTQQEMLELTERICDAIQHAHKKGIIHRDLKPSNILVTKDGQPHIVDFGLAKTSEKSESDMTISIDGELAGTLAFMAPEQAAGRMDQISVRTDVYSLGVILYRLVTGESPHNLSGSRYDTIKSIVEEDIVAPRELNPAIDADLESLILTALEKEPENRYPSAGVLRQDIRNYLNGEPLLARSMSTTYLIRKGVRKRAKPIAKVVALLLVVVAAIAIAYYVGGAKRNDDASDLPDGKGQAGVLPNGSHAQQPMESVASNEEQRTIENLVLAYQKAWNSPGSSNMLKEVISEKAYVLGMPNDENESEAMVLDGPAAIQKAASIAAQLRDSGRMTYIIRSINVYGPLAYVVGKSTRLLENGGQARSEHVHFLAKDETGWRIVTTSSEIHLRQLLGSQETSVQQTSQSANDETAIRALLDRINSSWVDGSGETVLNEILSDSAFAYATPDPNNPSEAWVLNKREFCRAIDQWQSIKDVPRHVHQVDSVIVFGPFAYEIGTTGDMSADGIENRQRAINFFAKEQAGWRMFFGIPGASVEDLSEALGLDVSDSQPATSQDTHPSGQIPQNLRAGDLQLPPGLVLYYSFDTPAVNNNITDLSSMENHGRLEGAEWVPNGIIGGAYSFDAVNKTDRIRVPDSHSLDCSYVTIAAWIKTKDDDEHWNRILDKGYRGGFNLCLGAGVNDKSHQGKALFEVNQKWVESKGIVGDGTWHHVAGTFDGQLLKLYVDGTLQNTTECQIPLPANSLDIGIGNEHPLHEIDIFLAFNGLIDEIMLFNRALSQQAVAGLYARAGKPSTTSATSSATRSPVTAAPPEPVVPPAPGRKKILFFSQSMQYEHEVIKRPSNRELSYAEKTFERLARDAGYDVVLSKDAADLSTESKLDRFAAIVFCTTKSPPINKTAMLDWLSSGRAFIGIHSACDSYHDWPEYGRILGGYYEGHGGSQQPVILKVDKMPHPSTRMLVGPWEIVDEIYQLKDFSRANVNVLLSVDTDRMSISTLRHHRMRKGQDYPVAWTNTYGNGRIFYTGLGHLESVWDDTLFQQHLLGGIKWALGESGVGLSTPVPRASFVDPGVSSRLLEGNVGLLRIDRVNNNTHNAARKALEVFVTQAVKGVVLDLRGSRGGTILDVGKVAKLFVPTGRILWFSKKGNNRGEMENRSQQQAVIRTPVAVLIDGSAGHGCELVAAAIQRNKLGAVLGQRTAGTTADMHLDGGIKSYFYLEQDVIITGRGLEPNIQIATGATEQQWLDAAIQSLRQARTGTSRQAGQLISAEDTEKMKQNWTGTVTGIGVALKADPDSGSIMIENVLIEETKQVGLQAGQKIVAVNGRTVAGLPMAQVVELIKGPEGSSVQLTIQSTNGITQKLSVMRAQFIVSGVSSKIISDNIGLIRITGFNMQTENAVKEALTKFSAGKVAGIVLDLRGNIHGLYREIVKVAEFFIPAERILWFSSKGDSQLQPEWAKDKPALDAPMVVLVDSQTAFGGELLACAIQRNKAGTLLGHKTLGEGASRALKEYSDGTSEKVVSARHYVERNVPISGNGIQPDIRMPPGSSEQQWLDRAAQVLENNASRP